MTQKTTRNVFSEKKFFWDGPHFARNADKNVILSLSQNLSLLRELK